MTAHAKNWDEFLTGFSARDLIAKDFKLIFVHGNDSVLDVLKILTSKQILCVPVMDMAEKKFLGFVDILDVITLVVMLAKTKTILDGLKQEVDWKAFLEREQEVFRSCLAKDIINASMRNPWCAVYEGLPLLSLMDMFSKNTKLHRVVFEDRNANMLGVISQSKVIEFLSKNLSRFPAKKLKDFFHLNHNTVLSANLKDLAIEAYSQMCQCNVSGLAVVNDAGELVGAISASDIKGSLEANLFTDIYLPIGLYLDKATPNFPRSLSERPISCTLDTTLSEAVSKLSSNHIHRVFVVDESSKPVAVLSLSDIITFLSRVENSQ